jgi:uncharacterized protein
MAGQTIDRPLWRAFPEDSLTHAAAFVRAGGHGVVWAPGRARPAAWLLLPCGPDGILAPLSLWVVILLGRRTYGVVRSRPARGLALLRVPRRSEQRVSDWCARDQTFVGATRTIALDCTACGACCVGCRPILRPPDVTRWRRAGRADLAAPSYIRRQGGRLLLRLSDTDHSCVHLDQKRCGIYPLRPYVCRIFPVGSEGCLDARRIVLGAVDGAVTA